ncbi:Mpo1-like protein [Paludisphaera rhizosphaerae]|uniref:Mpo1-like protein n=1 Tax=Paludisphaera rhizosphaerae TaxID=2711216 RepID=UPI0013E9EF4A|nr:Mpo1-like protein [Paludisphaera rhizosphaerae]
MIATPAPPHPLVVHWLKRHRSAVSFILHMIGIPPTILGVLLFAVYVFQISFPIFVLALGLFLGGYGLQLAGHALEGTDAGEVIYFKRLFGIPYVEFPPGFGPFHELPESTSAPAGDARVQSASSTGTSAGPKSL